MQLELTHSDWQLQLISLFCWVDDGFLLRGWDTLCERFSNNHEVAHLRCSTSMCLPVWASARPSPHHSDSRLRLLFLDQMFPKLPGYSAFVDRLNRLPAVLVKALEELADCLGAQPGWCASKSQYYYGLKLHVSACGHPGRMLAPMLAGVSAAREAGLRGLEAGAMGCCMRIWPINPKRTWRTCAGLKSS